MTVLMPPHDQTANRIHHVEKSNRLSIRMDGREILRAVSF